MARRIRIYLVGVVLGCILAYTFLIKGRESSLLGWLPSKRIIYDIENLESSVTNSAQCIMDCHNISQLKIDEILEEGDFDYAKSVTDSVPRVYYILAELSSQTIELEYQIWSNKVLLSAVKVKEVDDNCGC